MSTLPWFGWKAEFTSEVMRDGRRLHLWRHASGGPLEVARGGLTVRTVSPMTSIDEEVGIFLPGDAYEAIVAAIDPPAHKAEVTRLEEALALERRRVDDVLARRL